MDYYKSTRDRFFGRYNINQGDTDQENLFPNPLADSGQQFGGPELARNQSGAAGWTFIISPRMVNDFRYEYNNTASSFVEASYGLESASAFGFLGLPPSLDDVGSLPIMSTITNYNALGDGNYRPQFSNPCRHEVNDNLSIIKEAHIIDVGFDYRFKQDNFVDLADRVVAITFTGAYTGACAALTTTTCDAGDATADMLEGLTATAGAETFTEIHQQQISAYYAQDAWKVLKNFTMNLGLRYEYFTPTYGVGQYPNVNINLITGQLLVGPGAPLQDGSGVGSSGAAVSIVPASNRYAEQPDKDEWGPRVGLSYQVSSKFVARAGWGFYYDGEDIAGTTPVLTINPPNVYNITLPRGGTQTGTNANSPTPWNLAQPLSPNILVTNTILPSNIGMNAFYPYAQVGRIEEWNLALQYLLGQSTTLTLGYVGNNSHGMRQSFTANDTPYPIVCVNSNLPIADCNGGVQANRPYPQCNSINTESYFGASKYNSFQAEYERRATNGLTTLLAYTYANAADNTDDFGATGGLQSKWKNIRLPNSRIR